MTGNVENNDTDNWGGGGANTTYQGIKYAVFSVKNGCKQHNVSYAPVCVV